MTFVAAIILLSGCAHTTTVVQIEECYGGSNGIVECHVVVRFYRKSATIDDVQSFAVSQPRINLSQSNMDLSSTGGQVEISVKDSAGVLQASRSFSWVAIGKYVYPVDPMDIQLWLEDNFVEGDEIGFSIDQLEVGGDFGNNTVVAVLEFGGYTTGASDSFYLNKADLNGF